MEGCGFGRPKSIRHMAGIGLPSPACFGVLLGTAFSSHRLPTRRRPGVGVGGGEAGSVQGHRGQESPDLAVEVNAFSTIFTTYALPHNS
jgi:hypothetical protein